MGPKEGGTWITIVGENLGLTSREVGLRVAGVRCNSIPAKYISAERSVQPSWWTPGLIPHWGLSSGA